ncbi:AMP-binding protein [Enterovibrio norvegicus]|uniref:AMP-binding protein n=1 Tax=Enterovibrio norvegicus TaxID=188144 RepID=UPI000C81C46A|nr:AMP-binding protein [Enterovibrio norvegicus]PMH71528.1 acyl-CoA synthase [Enterovibrio norvegicus]
MIFVNDAFYGHEYFCDAYEAFKADPILGDCAGKRFAICSEDPAYVLSVCLYLRQHGGSFYPIFAPTPRLAAKRLANRAECHFLLFDKHQPAMTLQNSTVDKDAVLVQTSSGTTGEPKVITRTWQSIAEEVESYVSFFSTPHTMTPLIACPITHSYGLIAGVLVALKRGLTPVIINNINPKYLLKTLLNTPNHLLYSSPALINSVVQLYPKDQRLHAVMTSGTVLPGAWFDALREKTKHVFQQYGCSEAGCIAINTNTLTANQIGQPLPHLQVFAGNDASCPDEIVITKGDVTIHTQDLGYIDDKGALYFVSRCDDMINVSGLNVYPQDIENVVLEIPDVTEAIVFKRPDPFSGERVCLQFIATNQLEPSRIRHWCGTRLASYQLPVDIEQCEEIEKMANGKINRKTLSQSTISIPALG